MEKEGLEFLEEGCVWKGNHRVAMLLRNEMKGILPIRLGSETGEKRLSYDTAGYVSLEGWSRTRALAERDLRWVLGGVLEVIRQGEPFLLAPGCYFLTPDRIFLKPSKEEVRLCVRPKGEGDWKVELRETGRFFLEAIDYKEEDCVKLAYEFYHVCKREDLRPEDCRELLQARVYTIITEEGEQATVFQKTANQIGEGVSVGSAASWIQIEGQAEEKRLPEVREKMRREERRKKVMRGLLTGAAVLALLAVLWQSGF